MYGLTPTNLIEPPEWFEGCLHLQWVFYYLTRDARNKWHLQTWGLPEAERFPHVAGKHFHGKQTTAGVRTLAPSHGGWRQQQIWQQTITLQWSRSSFQWNNMRSNKQIKYTSTQEEQMIRSGKYSFLIYFDDLQDSESQWKWVKVVINDTYRFAQDLKKLLYDCAKPQHRFTTSWKV